jgi:hypothetical protein
MAKKLTTKKIKAPKGAELKLESKSDIKQTARKAFTNKLITEYKHKQATTEDQLFSSVKYGIRKAKVQLATGAVSKFSKKKK